MKFKVGDWVRHTKSGDIRKRPLKEHELHSFNCKKSIFL